MEALQKKKARKPDMQLCKKMKEEHTPRHVYGHIPGVAVGDVFNGRGEVAVLGLHTQICQGIDSAGGKQGAFAIVLSGGYKDDEDKGHTFDYTGQGGNVKGTQVKDQTWDTSENAALRTSQQTGFPVRVIRGSKPQAGATPKYSYDGLYQVKTCNRVASPDGPLVCIFRMEAIPGESTASAPVTFNSLFKRIMHGRRLASDDDGEEPTEEEEEEALGPGGRKRRKCAVKETAQQAAKRRAEEDREVARESRLREIRARYRSSVLVEDISGGLERLPIPVINTVNDEPPPADLVYIKDYEFAPFVEELVRPMLDDAERSMKAHMRGSHPCGLGFNRHMVQMDAALPEGNEHRRTDPRNYTARGFLLTTSAMGVHECGPSCSRKECLNNLQVTNGIRVPLEVFMTRDKGWGVRCADPLKAGQYVCSYIGSLITEPMAESRKGQDVYLFSLDHFVVMRQNAGAPELASVPPHHWPPSAPSARELDARLNAQIDKLVKQQRERQAEDMAAEAPRCAEAEGGLRQGLPDAAGGQASEDACTVAASDGLAAAARRCATSECGVLVELRAGEGAKGPPSAAEAESTAAQEPGSRGPPVDEKSAAGACATSVGCGGGSGALAGEHAPAYGPDSAGGPALAGAGPGSGAADLRAALEDATRRPAEAVGQEADAEESLLAIDASRAGNVARFINHSCDGNLLIQVVFAGRARSVLLYYISLYAARDIKANEEVTYDYGSFMSHVRPCKCGAANCVDRGGAGAGGGEGGADSDVEIVE